VRRFQRASYLDADVHRDTGPSKGDAAMSENRALLFDTFGTLVDWRTGLVTQLEQWGTVRNIAADWPSLVLAWRRDHVPALAKVRTGQREWANYDALQSETMRQLAPNSGCPHSATTPSTTWPRCGTSYPPGPTPSEAWRAWARNPLSHHCPTAMSPC
jgi:hypothetical protein